jgi:hypothetical protein
MNHLESFRGLCVLKGLAIQIYYLLSNRIERINCYLMSLDVETVITLKSTRNATPPSKSGNNAVDAGSLLRLQPFVFRVWIRAQQKEKVTKHFKTV